MCRLAQSLRRGVLKLWACGIYIVNSPIIRLFWGSLHDPVQVLNRRSCGDPGEILSTRPLHEELADVMS